MQLEHTIHQRGEIPELLEPADRATILSPLSFRSTAWVTPWASHSCSRQR